MSAKPHGLAQRLYHGETSYDFVGPIRRWFLISGAVILIGLVSLGTRGLNFGIDFRGGTAWEVRTTKVSVGEARDALRSSGLGDAKIQRIGGETLRVQADLGEGREAEAKKAEVASVLAKAAGIRPQQVSQNDVGPSWGAAITRKAERALLFFFVVISLYISFRFEWKMAVAALAAVVHDIFITVGVYSLSGFEVTPATVIAFLTILGYSLYDTIVVFDKVEENTRGLAATGRLTYGETVNLSMNQVLMRSINTSLVAILPILAVLVVGVYILGATTLQDFGLALLIGLLTGAYSSIFIASPLLAVLKEREPRYASIRQRLSSRGERPTTLTPAAAMAEAGSVGDGGAAKEPLAATARMPAMRPSRPTQAPRGRKKRRRR